MTVQKTCVLLANGKFPEHRIPLDKISKSKNIVCLDGAVNNLVKNKLKPSTIIGDLDSINPDFKKIYSEIIIETPNQDKNDLEKGLDWLENQGYSDITIIGATGLRDDHTLSNIFIILEKNYQMNIKAITDFGTFQIVKGHKNISSFKGQKVSLFTLKKDSKITTTNLKYQLNKSSINTLFYGALNESISSSFDVQIDRGSVLLYTAHSECEE